MTSPGNRFVSARGEHAAMVQRQDSTVAPAFELDWTRTVWFGIVVAFIFHKKNSVVSRPQITTVSACLVLAICSSTNQRTASTTQPPVWRWRPKTWTCLCHRWHGNRRRQTVTSSAGGITRRRPRRWLCACQRMNLRRTHHRRANVASLYAFALSVSSAEKSNGWDRRLFNHACRPRWPRFEPWARQAELRLPIRMAKWVPA